MFSTLKTAINHTKILPDDSPLTPAPFSYISFYIEGLQVPRSERPVRTKNFLPNTYTMRLFPLLFLAFLLACTPKAADRTAIGPDTDIDVHSPDPPSPREVFIEDLLAKMTLEEKIGQMTLFTSDWDVTGPTMREGYKNDIKAGRTGAIFNAHTAAYNRELQRIAVEETRLGIPLIFGYDVIHGYKTIFPIPLGETASWNMAALERSARVAAAESTAAGLHWTFAPMVDIARDPRWGRIMEGAGEDVYLGMQAAEARVKGFQGDDLSATNTMAACMKHFAAYGAAQAGRDYHTVDISTRSLFETYLPPFQAAVDAGVATVMTSFNEVDGVPASGSAYLLEDILRDRLGFEGFVVTDYTSINEMVPHGYSRDLAQAGEQALAAGVEMDMQGAVFYNELEKIALQSPDNLRRIDGAVRNILRVKQQLGLFEDPYKYSDEAREQRVIFSEENRQAAREVSRQSIVLLRNADNTLPLNKAAGTIAVIGELADSKADMLGAWHGAGEAESCVTLLEGLRAAVGEDRVRYAKGAAVEGEDKSGFAEAVRLARNSDAVVVAVGEKWWMSGEAASRTELDLPGVQRELVEELIKTGKPVTVVLMNGRPLALPYVYENADAVLETWFLGTMAGPAIADVLLGDYNPSGRLPVTIPRSVGQVPIFYSMKNTGRPFDANNKYTSKYLDAPNEPQYPFGYGLSYTTFAYSNLQLDKSSTTADNANVRVSVDVRNTGTRPGTETVQVYVHDKFASATRPVRELKGFRQVELAPGETKTVTIELTADAFSTLNTDYRPVVEPGDFDIYVGGDSTAELKQTLSVQ